jgi:hypothetical protein
MFIQAALEENVVITRAAERYYSIAAAVNVVQRPPSEGLL